MVAGSPLRVVRVLRPAPDLSAPSFNNKPVSVQPQGQVLYLGVLTPLPLLGSERVTFTGRWPDRDGTGGDAGPGVRQFLPGRGAGPGGAQCHAGTAELSTPARR